MEIHDAQEENEVEQQHKKQQQQQQQQHEQPCDEEVCLSYSFALFHNVECLLTKIEPGDTAILICSVYGNFFSFFFCYSSVPLR